MRREATISSTGLFPLKVYQLVASNKIRSRVYMDDEGLDQPMLL